MLFDKLEPGAESIEQAIVLRPIVPTRGVNILILANIFLITAWRRNDIIGMNKMIPGTDGVDHRNCFHSVEVVHDVAACHSGYVCDVLIPWVLAKLPALAKFKLPHILTGNDAYVWKDIQEYIHTD